jgi:hypothetical protein
VSVGKRSGGMAACFLGGESSIIPTNTETSNDGQRKSKRKSFHLAICQYKGRRIRIYTKMLTSLQVLIQCRSMRPGSSTSPPSSSPIPTRDFLFFLLSFPLALLAFQSHGISPFPFIVIHVGVELARGEAWRIDIVRRSAKSSSANGRTVFLVFCPCDRVCLEVDLR